MGSKWDDVCILNLQPEDSTINHSARIWKRRYRVPDERCFAYEADKSGFVRTTPDCLNSSVCNIGTKLMIFAHGNTASIHRWRANALGELLYNDLGLRQAGLIALKACHVGRMNFLETLGEDLAERGAEVGWLIGYKSSSFTLITSEATSFLDWTLHLVGMKLSDDKRIKVVKGNAWYYCTTEGSRRYGG